MTKQATAYPPLNIVIPAAGVGKRMQSQQAKQYLTILDKTIIEHTLEVFCQLSFVNKVIVVLSKEDDIFDALPMSKHPKVLTVEGGKERADSVLKGLKSITDEHDSSNIKEWVMVHDAARPCILAQDIINLYQTCLTQHSAGILANPVRDTMKRGEQTPNTTLISNTVERKNLWHALTPQCAQVNELINALESQVDEQGLINPLITDEASALELAQKNVLLVQGSVKNIKITMPEDLELATFYLSISH